MSNTYWYFHLEACRTIDEIGALWHGLLDARQMAPCHPAPRYRDAILQFAGMSALPPQLKLGALLAYGSAFDVDLRLVVGALHEPLCEDDRPWPDAVAASVSDNGPTLALDSADPWLGAFIAGRMAGLRETAVHDGVRLDAWHAAFWNSFLEMACRHGQLAAVRLALEHGADPFDGGGQAIAAAAAGPAAHEVASGDPALPDPVQEDYEAVLACLLQHGAAREQGLGVAFRSAAAADNVAALVFLLGQGADLASHGAPALAAAARHLAFDAFDWLRERGTGTRDPGLLAAAAASLDESMVDLVLAAGGKVEASANPAFLAALDAEPCELYSAELQLAELRVDMCVHLLRQGLEPDPAQLAAALRAVPGRRGVVEALLERDDLPPHHLEQLRGVLRHASQHGTDDQSLKRMLTPYVVGL